MSLAQFMSLSINGLFRKVQWWPRRPITV